VDSDPPNVRERAPAIPEVPPWTDVELPTEPLETDLVVPNWKFESLKDAVEFAKENDRIYARNGDHRENSCLHLGHALNSPNVYASWEMFAGLFHECSMLSLGRPPRTGTHLQTLIGLCSLRRLGWKDHDQRNCPRNSCSPENTHYW
jgi:hypothetical protein